MASLNTFLNKIFGSSNDRNLRKFKKRLEEINALEPVYEKLADQELVNTLYQKIKNNEYKRRQAAPGLRVSSKAFGIGRRVPIVNHYKGN